MEEDEEEGGGKEEEEEEEEEDAEDKDETGAGAEVLAAALPSAFFCLALLLLGIPEALHTMSSSAHNVRVPHQCDRQQPVNAQCI